MYANYVQQQSNEQRGAWLGMLFALSTFLAFVFVHVWREIPFGELPYSVDWIGIAVCGGWACLGLAWMGVRIWNRAARWAESSRFRMTNKEKNRQKGEQPVRIH
ncbi:MAG: hypothetical protein KIS92_25220 [Planctomycetota bacterium]|nr:hypothetical protein [Planctomycetota bacterium]